MMSQKRLCWLVAATFLPIASTSMADTITLLDGTSYNGLVTYSSGKFKVRTQIKDGEFTRFVPREEVSLIEFNNLRTNPAAPRPEISKFQIDTCNDLAAQSSTGKPISDLCFPSTVAGKSQASAELAEIKKSLPPDTDYSIIVTKTSSSDEGAATIKYADQKKEFGKIFDVPKDQVHVMSAVGDASCDKCTYVQVSRVHTAPKKMSERFLFTLVTAQTFSGVLSDISDDTIKCVDAGSGSKKQLERSQVTRIAVSK
jgi:hypothetical protein